MLSSLTKAIPGFAPALAHFAQMRLEWGKSDQRVLHIAIQVVRARAPTVSPRPAGPRSRGKSSPRSLPMNTAKLALTLSTLLAASALVACSSASGEAVGSSEQHATADIDHMFKRADGSFDV